MKKQKGKKNDNVKAPLDLLDPEFLIGLGEVLGHGAKAYSKHNWRSGLAYSRVIAAAYRHLGAINRGQDIDKDSGLPAVYHLACEVMFLSWFMKHRRDLDDRYKY